jgi:hypothetical protein
MPFSWPTDSNIQAAFEEQRDEVVCLPVLLRCSEAFKPLLFENTFCTAELPNFRLLCSDLCETILPVGSFIRHPRIDVIQVKFGHRLVAAAWSAGSFPL